MILFHRLSSFLIALLVGATFLLLFLIPQHPYVIMMFSVVMTTLVLGRLLEWRIGTFQFWHLLGTPMLFLLSSFGPFLLLENQLSKTILSVLVVLLMFMFVEHVFSFLHLPINYQPFTLEYLSQLLHLLSIFALALLGFGLSLFLQAPLWLLSLIFFLIAYYIVYSTLWVGKIDPVRARVSAFAGAVLATELFAVLSFLPTGFYSNAAFVALGVYIFLGLARVDALHKFSKDVLRRYVVVFFLLAFVIILTSQWV